MAERKEDQRDKIRVDQAQYGGDWRMEDGGGGRGTKRGSKKEIEEVCVCGRMGRGGLAAGVVDIFGID